MFDFDSNVPDVVYFFNPVLVLFGVSRDKTDMLSLITVKYKYLMINQNYYLFNLFLF